MCLKGKAGALMAEEELDYYPVDPYSSLSRKHGIPSYYTYEWSSFDDCYIIVRNDVSGHILSRDPQYIDLSNEEWFGEEFRIGDELPEKAIATPTLLLHACRKKLKSLKVFTVTLGPQKKKSAKRREAYTPKIPTISEINEDEAVRDAEITKSSSLASGKWIDFFTCKRRKEA